jgi:hypothetical protein
MGASEMGDGFPGEADEGRFSGEESGRPGERYGNPFLESGSSA